MNWYVELKLAGFQPVPFRDLQKALKDRGYTEAPSNGPHLRYCNLNNHCVPVPRQRLVSPVSVKNLANMIGTDYRALLQ